VHPVGGVLLTAAVPQLVALAVPEFALHVIVAATVDVHQ